MSGDFSLRTGVSIGNRTLATYSYTNDRNHYLSALDYGNEDSVNYTYDNKGRVTGQTYEDGDTVAKGTREPSPCPTNIQGDITAILNTAGTAVVSYTYDAWGNILSINGSMADTLGQLNPLRYRGYVYDNETGLYYLQSRYYNPRLGRFISADTFVSTGQGFVGYNMFAYCNNNPIMYRDDSGQFPWVAVIIIGVCVIVGGVLGFTYEGELGTQANKRNDSSSINRLPPNQNKDSLLDESEGIDVTPQGKDNELTLGDRVKNTLIGAGLGLAVGGAIVATGGAIGAVTVGSATTYITLLGGTGAQTFAIGALAYDVFAMIIAPFFQVEMETIEIEP